MPAELSSWNSAEKDYVPCPKYLLDASKAQLVTLSKNMAIAPRRISRPVPVLLMYWGGITHVKIALAVEFSAVSAFAEMTSIVLVKGTSKFVAGMGLL